MNLCWICQKAPFSKCVRPHENEKPAFFKFIRVDERFRKAPFLRRISVEIKLRFLIFPP